MAWKYWLTKLAERHAPPGSLPASWPDDIAQAWQLLRESSGLDDGQLATAASQLLGAPVADLEAAHQDLTGYMSESQAKSSLALPLRMVGNRLQVVTCDPDNADIAAQLGFASGREIDLVFAPPDAVLHAIDHAYRRITQPAASEAASVGEPTAGSENSIMQLADVLLARAVRVGASDIHVHPDRGGTVVRMRVDGMLRRERVLSRTVGEYLVRHFLAISDLDPTILFLPQDGRHQVQLEGRVYDLRISLLPVHGGQSLVIRILNQSRSFSLKGLGFSTADRMALQRCAGHTSGIVIFAGPTGSGKTTSLYALLAGLNRTEISIATIEDPVEYEVAGLAQTEINDRRGMTFENAIRSMVRQDPDILLIGEIRDRLSAAAATRMAMTGKLVLTTLHAGSARAAIPRLTGLGLGEREIGETLIAVVAQRLIRRLCTHCAVPVQRPLQAAEEELFKLVREVPARRAVGCQACAFTGYSGRIPILEVFEPAPAERAAMMEGQFSQLLGKSDPANDALARSALEMMVSGTTSIEEAERLLGPGFWTGLARMVDRPVPVLNLGRSFGESRDIRPGVLVIGMAEEECEALRPALEQAGYTFLFASTPEAGGELLRQADNVYCIVLDLAGREAESEDELRAVRQAVAWSGVPVLYLAPHDYGALLDVLRERAPGRVLDKPADAGRIVAGVRRMMH